MGRGGGGRGKGEGETALFSKARNKEKKTMKVE
jgi:hypothetical protein